MQPPPRRPMLVGRAVPPAWTAAIDLRLARARDEVRLLAAATPVNAVEERARLAAAFARGEAALPAWRYRQVDLLDTRRALDALERAIRAREGDPVADLYAGRAHELAVEAAMCEAVGTPSLAPLAAARYAPFSDATRARADALATAWSREREAPEAPERLVATDDEEEPESLVTRLRAEVRRRGLAFDVVVHAPLAALAATGERTIFVAAGRRIGERAARRTVLHEIDGHALPRQRAREALLGLLAIGTARASDDQEGYALWLESRHGFLEGARRRELAARCLAVTAMRGGASFVETVRHLVSGLGLDEARGVAVAERVFRGSHGSSPGLGREHVYLEAFVRVRDRLDSAPDDERALSAGQVSLDAIAALAPFLANGPALTDL